MKKSGADLRGTPTLTIRSSGVLALNAEFYDAAGDAPCCGLFISGDGRRFAIELKEKSDGPNDYTLSPDGGSARTNRGKGRVIAASGFVNSHPRLKAHSSVNAKLPIQKELRGNKWVVELQPMFEQSRTDTENLPTGVRGIYRLIFKNNIVYIGKGIIRDRVAQHKTRFSFDEIQFSEIDSEKEMFQWEAFYLEEYVREFGVKPEYNRIMGQSTNE